MCDKAANTYHSTMQFVFICYKTQEMYHEAANRCFVAFIHIPNR